MAGNEHNRPKHALHCRCKAIESDRRGSHTQRISRPLNKRRWTIGAVHISKHKINFNLNKCFNDNLSMLGTFEFDWNRCQRWLLRNELEKLRIIFSNKICKRLDSQKKLKYRLECESARIIFAGMVFLSILFKFTKYINTFWFYEINQIIWKYFE